MKRQSKVKHQGPSVEDEGETSGLSGDTVETEKVRVGKGDGSDYGKSLNPDPVQTDHKLEGSSVIKSLKSIRFPQQQTDHSKHHRSELFHTEEAKNRKFTVRLICRRQKRKSPVALPKYRSKKMDSSRMKQSSVIKEEEGGVSWEMSGHRQEEELVKDRKTEPDQQTKHLDQSVFGSAETQKVQDVSYLTPALPFRVCSSDDDKMHTSQIWPTDISGRHIGSSSCLIQATDDESLDSHPDSSTFPKLEMSSTRLPTERNNKDIKKLVPKIDLLHHVSPWTSSSQSTIHSVVGPPPVHYPSSGSVPFASLFSISADFLLPEKKPQVDHHNFSLVASHPHLKPGDSGYSENKTSRVQSPFPNRPKVTVEPHKATNVLSTRSHHVQPLYSRRSSRCLSRSHSDPSLSKVTSAETETLKRSKSLPDMKLNSSFEEFTPDISVGEDDETYSFRFSRSGLYQCSVTGLLFHMEGEGDVVYRTVPWNRRLLAQHHKKPAGPLFDIKCEQQSVCQLHLPHCEILSTGRRHFLSVAHVNDDVTEFISPHKITETHVVVNITGFSEFGNVMDEGAPPDPVRALVLLFYKPPINPDPESVINVLMLPKNISLPDVLRFWKKLGGDERYIKTSPHCKLHPDQDYTLSTCPEDDSVLVQPTEAEFDCSNYDNYFPSFEVILERIMKHIKLLLRDKHSSNTVWERRVCLSYAEVKRSCEPSPLDLPSDRRLLDVRSSFIESVSDPVLKTLLDRLFDKKVITDSERESADEIKNNRDKARCVMDTVRRKGEAASSEMIKFLCELDPFLCEHLGLM